MAHNICFIGLGHMGYPMASCLVKAGMSITVSDINQDLVDKFIKDHPTSKPMLLENLGNINTVITMLPNSDIVESALLGSTQKPGIINNLNKGTVVIDMSSSEPLRTRNLAAELKKQDLILIDAPVSGGVKKAIDGSLAIMVGGENDVVARFMDMLKIMGNKIIHVGNTGSGHAAKALNNYVSAAGLIAVADALHIGERFDIDPEILTDVLNASSGRNNTTENKAKQYMISNNFTSGFALSLMAKDVGIAINLGKNLDYSTRVGDACLATWQEGSSKSSKEDDHTKMYQLTDGKN